MSETQTSVETPAQPETVEVEIKGDDTATDQPQVNNTESSSGADTVKTAQDTQTDPETTQSGTSDDYLGGSSSVKVGEPTTETESQHDFEKRYRDSSREAQRQKARADALEQAIKADPDVFERLQGQLEDPGTSNSEVAEIKQYIMKLERENNNNVIRQFESGKNITTKIRDKMRPVVRALVTHDKNPLSLEEALQVAYGHVAGNNTTVVSEEAKAQAFAAMHVNGQATVRSSNSAKSTAGGTRFTLTPQEYALAKKLGAVDESTGKIRQSFITQLDRVRKENN
jgi:hypothetical protein